MKTISTAIAFCLAALTASTVYAMPAGHARLSLVPVQYVQPLCRFPARWVWRGFWSCEYPAPVFYPRHSYGYYDYGGGRYGGGHFGGGRGHSGGHHGGRR